MNRLCRYGWVLLLVLWPTVGAFGQTQGPSTMQQQADFYGQYHLQTDQQWDSLNQALTGHLVQPATGYHTQSACTPQKMVFGWYPYWSGTTYTNFDWSLLTDLCYFDYTVSPSTGNNLNSSFNFLGSPGVTAAQSHGVRTHLCITMFSSHATFFGSSTAKQTLISNVISLLRQRNATGVNVDFEAMYSSGLQSGFTGFMESLCTQVHDSIPNSKVSVAIQWSSNGAIDFATLNNYVDYWIPMGYDYYTGSGIAGPTDPLYGFASGGLNLAQVVNKYISTYALPPSKILLALPYYGNGWGVNTACGLGVAYNSSIVTRTITSYNTNAQGYFTAANHRWDSTSFSNYYCFTGGTSPFPTGANEFFIDDVDGMKARLDLINARNLAGLGIWALGYDDGTSDYWNLISQNLTSCAAAACADTLYDMGGPLNNYNAYEDWSYTISPPGATSITLNFLQLDLESGYDSIKIYDGTSTSSPLLGAFSGNSLPNPFNALSGSFTVKFHSDVSTQLAGFRLAYACNSLSTCNDTYEPNDSATLASTAFPTLSSANLSDSIQSAISNGNDVDWYKLTVNNYGTLALNLHNLPANYDLVLYNAGLSSVASSANSGTSAENISYNITAGTLPATFYVKVLPNSSSQYHACNKYTLLLNWSPTVVVTCTPPAAPNPVFGTNTCPGTTVGNGQAALTWTGPNGASYNLAVSEYPYGSTHLVYTNHCLTGTSASLTSPTITAGKLYRYNLQSTSDCDTCNSSYGGTNYFHLPPSILPTGTVTICAGNTVTLRTPSITVGSPGVVNYLWYKDGQPLGNHTDSLVASTSGSYYVRLVYTGSTLCTNADTTSASTTVVLQVNPLPNTPTIQAPATVCLADSLLLVAQGSNGSSYHWTSPNGSAYTGDSLLFPLAIYPDSGIYTCYATLNGCNSAIDSQRVSISGRPAANAGGLLFICPHDSVLIGTPAVAGNNYQWLPSMGLSDTHIAQPFAQPDSNRRYYLTVTNAAGCTNTDSMQVVVNIPPAVDAGNDTAIAVGNTMVLGGQPVASGASPFIYSWWPADSVSNPTTANPTTQPNANNTYVVQITDANGCTNTDTVQVVVNPITCSFALSDTGFAFNAPGGSHAIIVTANDTACHWTVSNPANWLHVAISGNTVTLTADSCNFNGDRTDTLSIANISYLITQDCFVPSPCNPPSVHFYAMPDSGNCPLSVDFVDSSTIAGNASYTWVIQNGSGQPIISHQQNPTGIVFNVDGQFDVQLTVTDSCGTDSLLIPHLVTVHCPNGIPSLNTSATFTAYPNPTTDNLQVIASGLPNGNYTLTLQDITGRTLLALNPIITNGTLQQNLSLQGYAQGLYLLTLRGQGVLRVLRVGGWGVKTN